MKLRAWAGLWVYLVSTVCSAYYIHSKYLSYETYKHGCETEVSELKYRQHPGSIYDSGQVLGSLPKPSSSQLSNTNSSTYLYVIDEAVKRIDWNHEIMEVKLYMTSVGNQCVSAFSFAGLVAAISRLTLWFNPYRMGMWAKACWSMFGAWLFSVYCIVCAPPKAKSSSVTICLTPFNLYYFFLLPQSPSLW